MNRGSRRRPRTRSCHGSNRGASFAAPAYFGVSLGLAWGVDDRTNLKLALLYSDSLSLAWAYHATLQFLTGRDGASGDERPRRLQGLTMGGYSASAPSRRGRGQGRAPATGALLSVFSEQFGSWAASTLAIAGTTYVGASLIYNDQHFASDILRGASMGWAVGAWVMRYRSTRFHVAGDSERSVQFLPLAVPGGIGATVGGVW